MVKVYDMVTYGLSASEDDAPALSFGTPHAADRVPVPETALQLREITPATAREMLPPCVRGLDVDSFLAACDD